MRAHCVLVVEDDDAIRESMCFILESEGYRVDYARNGLEALKHLDKHPGLCLVLLDLMMPVMNGWEFLEKREETPSLAEVPVVVVSAAVEKRRISGSVALIKKPPDLDVLLGLIDRYCDKEGESGDSKAGCSISR